MDNRTSLERLEPEFKLFLRRRHMLQVCATGKGFLTRFKKSMVMGGARAHETHCRVRQTEQRLLCCMSPTERHSPKCLCTHFHMSASLPSPYSCRSQAHEGLVTCGERARICLSSVYKILASSHALGVPSPTGFETAQQPGQAGVFSKP